MVMKPAWLQGLMAETFFVACGVHDNCRKNEKNIFCLNCCLSFCRNCLLSHHPSHPLLQIRRYVYQDVIRLDDLEKLIDCSYIQSYTINSAKVIFLHQREHSRSCKGSSNSCFTCHRILQDSFHFCSLSCKVDYMVHQGNDLSGILSKLDHSNFYISRFEDLRVDVADDREGSDYRHRASNSRSKKKGGFLVLSFGSRRKGAPQRSPLS
ncbi:protein RGF1 INDUCIBLE TRANSCRIPTION FACTOR 1-like [Salvia splendens]|uniref:protein RGF1 INDUCIBLE TRANSCRIPTION FACTOR 1-like n=1 Tax=Salvia splendens TaxID=180675 RepID=UPI001C2534E4|nr:protein RGF1 INDUCIBLE TRANSCRIPTION FACTOR 1-like [Salvia splendens]